MYIITVELLDLSWKSIAVGGICCGFVTPVILLLQFLFRKSKVCI